MNAESVVALLTAFSSPNPDMEQLKAVEAKLIEIRSDPNNLGLALELLKSYSQHHVIWLASSIIERVVSFLWVPRSMQPDPNTSLISQESKDQIRQFFVSYLTNQISSLDLISQNFIYKLIALMMKIDFANEGSFWLSFAQEVLQDSEKRKIGLTILRFLSDELQSFADHSITSKTKHMLKQSFISIVPGICQQLVIFLQNSLQTPDAPSNVESFSLLKSFLLWISPIYITGELIGTLFLYSKSSMGKISFDAHNCVYAVFYRIDLFSVQPIEFREELLRITFDFFYSEMSNFPERTLSKEYIQSLLHAFQPFAANYFFKEDFFDPAIVSQFLANFEVWTWATFGTPNFAQMIEIWGDLFHGQEGSRYWNEAEKTTYTVYFMTLVEHCLEAMVSMDHISAFTEEDYLSINDMINEIAKEYPLELCRLVHRTTATAINANLPSIHPVLTCFFHLISRIKPDESVHESISNSLLRYLNELMTKTLPIDVEQIFPIVETIVKCNVRPFSRNSLHFADKVFYLLTISVNMEPFFIQPMLELMLETVKIYRPESSCRVILSKLLDMQPIFCQMPLEMYSLYLCICETIAAYMPTDTGKKPLTDESVISQIFALVFGNLTVPEQMQYSLILLRDATNNIAISSPVTKNIVFAAFSPYIDTIMGIYENSTNTEVLSPLLEFITAFCVNFHNQIAERMSELLGRLLAPLGTSLTTIEEGSIQQLALSSVMKIIFGLSNFRTHVSEHQTLNIAEILVRYAHLLYQFQTSDVQSLCSKTLQNLIKDRWALLPPPIQSQLLQILFFNGLTASEITSVTISIDAIIEAHEQYQILYHVDEKFRYQAFATICQELCKCTNTSLREKMLGFAVFFCSFAPDFHDTLLFPFIKQLPISESDQKILAESFSSISDVEFEPVFSDFCDDVSYLLMHKMMTSQE